MRMNGQITYFKGIVYFLYHKFYNKPKFYKQMSKITNKLRGQLSPAVDKFNAYRLGRNRINKESGTADDEGEYVFEEIIAYQKKMEVQKINTEGKQAKENQRENKKDQGHNGKISKYGQNVPVGMIEPSIYSGISPCKIVTPNTKNNSIVEDKKIEDQSEQDLTDLWNKMEDQHQSSNQQQKPIQLVKKIQELQPQNIKIEESCSDSSCQLTQQQLQRWMQQCKIGPTMAPPTPMTDSNHSSDSMRHSYRINCIYQQESTPNKSQYFLTSDKQNPGQNQKAKDDLWGSWTDIVNELQAVQMDTQIGMDKQQKELNIGQVYSNKKLACLENNNEDIEECQEFVIMDAPFQKLQYNKKTEENSQNEEEGQKFIEISPEQLQKYARYGPWNYPNAQIYQIHQNYKISYIHEQNLKNSNRNLNNQPIPPNKLLFTKEMYEAARPLRKINWQIREEKKPESKILRSKRNCRMSLIQYGKDFYIFDPVKFAISPIREGNHVYFGIQAHGYFQKKQLFSMTDLNPSKKQLKQYLYLPSNGQCLLQTSYQDLQPQQALLESKVKKFNILLSLTKQKLAICKRTVIDQVRQKRQIIQVKLYDNFECCEAQYLAIIESKISNFSQQWYCDTVIHIPRKKLYSNKISQKNWQKFKIQLRLSQTGTIVAQLGIFDAESSVTNCILFGESKLSQFMMGTLYENVSEINYILRLAGISPVVGFATAISRKIFVVSS